MRVVMNDDKVYMISRHILARDGLIVISTTIVGSYQR